MSLAPCPRCLRHVSPDDAACPFCGEPTAAPAPRPPVGGRLSRAAVFAGAALTGCYTSSTPSHYGPPPPPPDDTRQQQQQPPPPDDRSFARPPAAGTGTIEGIVIGERTRTPFGLTQLELQGPGTRTSLQAGRDGRFRIADVPPGQYYIVAPSGHPRRGPDRSEVTVTAGQVELTVYEYDPRAMPTPYGAPPARSRIV